MDIKNSIALLEQLCQISAPSGCERRVGEYILGKVKDICPEADFDRMGNLICPMRFGNKERRRVMVCAHMDEVGFMVNNITSDGYLSFSAVGGISDSVLAARPVTVISENGEITGVIASKAIHHKTKDEREKPVEKRDLYIDIGACDREDAEKYVQIGDFASFLTPFYTFGTDGKMIKGKALDDRAGCAAMIEIMHSLAKDPPKGTPDVFFCFTTREEIGYSGAIAAAYEIRPDIAIVLETTAIGDVAKTAPALKVADVGAGVVISVMDRSTIYSKELVTFALEISKRKGIPAQLKRYVSGGNDAGNIHKTADGARTLALSIPTRYLHSPACVCSADDYISQRDLCEQIIRNISEVM